MERVSFGVAKAIKEYGYPQFESNYHWCANWDFTGKSYRWVLTEVPYMWEPEEGDEKYFVDAPTYIDVWLWLWREKDICIEVKDNHYHVTAKVKNKRFHGDTLEEAIIAAIKHLVENDLMK